MAEKEKDSDKGSGKGRNELPPPPPSKKSKLLMNIFLISLLGLIVLGFLGYKTFEPQDLSDIDGYREEAGPAPLGHRNIGTALENAFKNKSPLQITEEEINEYILSTLKFEQEGWLKDYVAIKGVWVRLEKDVIEVIIEREVKGKTHTVSMLYEPEQKMEKDGTMSSAVHRKKGKWGGTRVPNGFLYLTNSSFEALTSSFADEIGTARRMVMGMFQMNVSEGVIEFHPPDPDPEPSL